MSDISENRRVRFGNLPSVGKADVIAASEMWLDDLIRAPWATREAMKLAAHLVNYMLSANRAILHVREIETTLQLNREEINRALNLMRLFRTVATFTVEKDEVQAGLYLSGQQMLRLVELRQRQFALLAAHREPAPDGGSHAVARVAGQVTANS